MPSTPDSTDFSKLIPELKDWNEGKGIDIQDWIWAVSSLEHAVGIGSLFWPAFVEHDGAVFLALGFTPKACNDFKEQTERGKRAVEEVLNHRHISDLFRWSTPPKHEMLIHVGRLMKEMWECKLKRDFPGKSFTVSFPEQESDDPLAYEVTFFQNE